MDAASGFIGNPAALEVLRRALGSEAVPHAYLFTGQPHVGKSTLAGWLAQALLCESKSDGSVDPCGTCHTCARIARRTHPDVQVFDLARQDAETNRSTPSRELGIDTIRQIVADVGLLPFEARRKVYVVEDAGALTEEAANSFLKTLEEPPEFATLVLLAVDAASLPDTVTSRATVLKLRPVPREEILEALRRRFDLPERDLERIADLSEGRPGWAIRAASSPEVVEQHDANVAALAEALSGGSAARLALAERLAGRWSSGHRDEVYSTLFDWLGFWREAMHVASGRPVRPAYSRWDNQVRSLAGSGVRATADATDRTLRAIAMLDANVNTRLAVESLLLSIP